MRSNKFVNDRMYDDKALTLGNRRKPSWQRAISHMAHKPYACDFVTGAFVPYVLKEPEDFYDV